VVPPRKAVDRVDAVRKAIHALLWVGMRPVLAVAGLAGLALLGARLLAGSKKRKRST
jgi:hypothetical protein